MDAEKLLRLLGPASRLVNANRSRGGASWPANVTRAPSGACGWPSVNPTIPLSASLPVLLFRRPCLQVVGGRGTLSAIIKSVRVQWRQLDELRASSVS